MIYQPIENTGEYTTGTVYSEEYVKRLEQEIERLNNIIKEVREYIKKMEKLHFDYSYEKQELLEILDKEVN